ncbi:MAG TPA: ABC transporter ATP-binding protein [Gammaproteobacteria bacterium]|nr:ABC transporter ATP-binding protein [Gammaproteobacteria bacterium]
MQEDAGKDQPPKGATYFLCHQLNAQYGDARVVRDVSFGLKEGEIVALLGPCGAGKTAVLRTLARSAEPYLRSGEIWLEGEPVHDKQAFEAAQIGIQLVPEGRRIIPGLTVEENLELAQIAGLPGWSYERIYGLFPCLEARRQDDGTVMSAGEQQMLAIARALSRDAKLLLLDEPYADLPNDARREIEHALLKVKQYGITTVIVERQAAAVLDIADSAIIMDEGQVVFRGPAYQARADDTVREANLVV